MRLLAGTSGYSYPEWKGTFYPEGLADSACLAYYAERLPTVEINNTFYRMPRPEMLERWAAQVPAHFRFVIKASRRITHQARLVAAGDSVAYLWKAACVLGDRLGPVLFQTPPNLKFEIDRLEAFLDVLPEGCRAAFELRHPSWADDRTFAALRARNHAWCVADTDGDGDDDSEPDVIATADWGYLRLRRSAYSDGDLGRWAERLAASSWNETYVFFKHEEEGAAPAFAMRFAALLD